MKSEVIALARAIVEEHFQRHFKASRIVRRGVGDYERLVLAKQGETRTLEKIRRYEEAKKFLEEHLKDE